MIKKLLFVLSLCLFPLSNSFSESSDHERYNDSAEGKIERELFGQLPSGEKVYQYVISNRKGLSVALIDYGATIVSIRMPDKNGKMGNIVLGYDDLDGYINDSANFGGTIGRFANRIAKGKCTINGEKYVFAKNDNGINHIHGGVKGFNKVLWKGDGFNNDNGVGVKYHYLSKDGEEGYPGNLDVYVTFTLNNNNELIINYQATTDKPTVVNLTNHSYFNLYDAGMSSALDHHVYINADKYTPVDKNLIPTGEIKSVLKTPLDFTEGKLIGKDIDKVSPGYDFNYVLNKEQNKIINLAAVAFDRKSGRELKLYTTEPGVQFYTGNYLEGIKGKGGIVYKKHHAFCFEPQHYPDSPNHPAFPSTLLKPGDTYKQTSIFSFSLRGEI